MNGNRPSARSPGARRPAFLGLDTVLEIARAGAAAGCREARFTLGDVPGLRSPAARAELSAMDISTPIEYVARAARAVLEETGLLIHVSCGVMNRADLSALRGAAASMGLMLAPSAARLGETGGPQPGGPDSNPASRLETIRLAGELNIPFTGGVVIGIGETRAERLESLAALAALALEHGHLQDVMVQDARARPGTRPARNPDGSVDDLLWTIAAARMVLPEEVRVQVSPNLAYDDFPRLLEAGVDDCGGVSPATVARADPAEPWPDLRRLEATTRDHGLELVPRLPLYPHYVADLGRWVDPALAPAVRRASDSMGLAREDAWAPGEADATPPRPIQARAAVRAVDPGVRTALAAAAAGDELCEADAVALLRARGHDRAAVLAAADGRRRDVCGDEVTYVVTRNIQYTNVCYFKCGFCAFSKGRLAANLRGKPYLTPVGEIVRRAREAWERGAVEVCLQGGIHPAFDGDYYASIVEALRREVPGLHVHAFSALEIWQGAATLGVSLEDYLKRLRDIGLSSLPGTAAEILDDEVRQTICPDKIDTAQWLGVHETAHRVGLRSNVTMMFGHVDGPRNWARHLIRAREQQQRSGGFTEFVPLPFVHMEAPIWRRGRARSGPTFGETLLVHATARLVLHPHIRNIQASWVKLGPVGVRALLAAGVNDLGGTLMNESISRAAGSDHGQEMPPERMDALIRSAGRGPRQRTTLYGEPPPDQVARSYRAAPLQPPSNPPVRDAGLRAPPVLLRPREATASEG